MLPEFKFNSTTDHITFGNVAWYTNTEDVNPGDIVDIQKGYQIYMSAKAEDGYTLEDADVYFNGKKVGTWIAWPLSMGGAEIGGTFFLPIEEKASLEIINGTDTYTVGESTEAEFEINADYSLFEEGGKVYIDGDTNPLAQSNYTSREGSTIITLNQAYVDTLSVGKHILKVVFNDNNAATTSFNVVRNTSNEETNIENNNNTTKTNTNNTQKTENKSPTGINNPKTSDNILFYITMLLLSITGLSGTTFVSRKSLN